MNRDVITLPDDGSVAADGAARLLARLAKAQADRGVASVVLTGGVGENAAYVRAGALAGLDHLGITVDPALNDSARGLARISPGPAPVAVLVVPTDEEWEIARQAVGVVRGAGSRLPGWAGDQ